MAVPIGTALIYDQEMTKYKLLWDDLVCKIEVPERLTASYQALVKSGLSERCISVPARQATDEEILLTHSVEYLEAVKKTCFMNVEELMTFTQQYEDVYFHPNIYHCAKLAVGAALQLVDSVMMGRVRNGMALVRPPGHHSQRSAANGFCVFNNVAIAAHYAKKKYGVKRVLIVDWDVHHGQGVQYSFEEDPSVLYFSWHRYEHQSFWPNLRESDYDSVGKGKGVGFNINVPWNKVGMENSDYLLIFFHVLLPVAYEFCPDLVMVCAGFDSAIGDPEGCMCATPDIFAHLTHLLMHLAGGKLCAVLEGGYNLTSLSQSVCQTVHTLLGDPAPCPSELGGPSHSALESLQCVRATQKPHWACLKNTVDPSTCEFSTSNLKTSTKDEIGKDVQFACELVEREKAEADNVDRLIWQEHPSRLASSIRTAVELPDGVEVPNNCISTHSPLTSNLVVREHLRENFFKESVDEDILVSLCNVVALVEKIAKNEVRNGLALVPDISLATICAVQQALGLLINRVLLVLIGDEAIPKRFTDDGKVLLVRIGRMEQEDPIPPSKYHIPVHLEKGCCDMAGFMHAVLGLLLPVAYEYDPKLVLLVHMPNSGAQDIAWAQLTSLLQGLAEGHTLALIQVNKMSCIRPTAASLLGEPAPSLGELGAPLQKDGDAMIRLRKRLETDWELLKTTAICATAGPLESDQTSLPSLPMRHQ